MIPFPNIDASHVEIGVGVHVDPSAIIKGKCAEADRVVVGDYSYIGPNVKLMAPIIEIGEYTKIHEGTFAYGGEPLRIGGCCWIGGHVILDCVGGLTLENGVGIGSGSQVWTHIKFGDVVQGCRFNSRKQVTIGEDAWFVGHCLVSPVIVERRSMAMLGSVVTRDMRENRVYAGVPAVDVTDRMGQQFFELEEWEKWERLTWMLAEFEEKHPEYRGQLELNKFDVQKRTYRKEHDPAEVAFMRMWVPLAKFYPETDE